MGEMTMNTTTPIPAAPKHASAGNPSDGPCPTSRLQEGDGGKKAPDFTFRPRRERHRPVMWQQSDRVAGQDPSRPHPPAMGQKAPMSLPTPPASPRQESPPLPTFPPICRSSSIPKLSVPTKDMDRKRNKVRQQSVSILATNQSKPILPGLLPATTRPVPLTARPKSTIQILPRTTTHGIMIHTHDQSTLNVDKDGRRMVVEFIGTRKDRKQQLLLKDQSKWTDRERKEWDTVWQLVEGFKRVTPRVSD